MHHTGSPNSQNAALEQLWQQVCASRGTPAPEAGQRAQVLQGLSPEARRMLETVLLLAARGRERPGDPPPCQTSCRSPVIADDPHWSAIHDNKSTFN